MPKSITPSRKHGGTREGAGRPPTVSGKKREVYLSDEDWEYLLKVGKKNASRGTRLLIHLHIEQLKEIEKEYGL
jgi:hypothetical protein